ncbi:dienelactone hydrolase family protein [Hydrogenophaga sp.]|uniref:dienelactone hydrolase family protein n=1 Tax=Hydrogenophaga sp. TaxID=1904254 RepID=UPI0027316DC6|nr:dienelactone hydrolase family protein [Hydrogenophaga sp.]MDP2018833.1 dienelactone hydrolase family protein [Hydrogenophaga sp.]MDP3165628.1 dienelactone hydrolase family protein [Hydrogenophaga sp.]
MALRRFNFWLAALLLPPALPAQDLIAVMSAGPPTGRYAFASSSPRTLPDLLKGPGQGEAAQPVGHWFLPPGAERGPAVVLIHGSGGIYDAMLDFWPKQFNAAGIAVLAVDSFGPRGVKSTAEDQSQVPFSADIADAFAALKLVASHPRVDPARIAVMGFSRGGITAWRTAVERIAASQQVPGGLRFAAHVPVYSGGCSGVFRLLVKPGVFSPKAPMLWVHGDADDYTSIGACRDYAERIGKAGTPVEFVTLAGAMHKFDQNDTRRFDVRGAQRALETCPLELDIEAMVMFDRTTGQRVSGEAIQTVNRQSCSAVGASVQGDHAARDKAAQAILAFFRKTLGSR